MSRLLCPNAFVHPHGRATPPLFHRTYPPPRCLERAAPTQLFALHRLARPMSRARRPADLQPQNFEHASSSSTYDEGSPTSRLPSVPPLFAFVPLGTPPTGPSHTRRSACNTPCSKPSDSARPCSKGPTHCHRSTSCSQLQQMSLPHEAPDCLDTAHQQVTLINRSLCRKSCSSADVGSNPSTARCRSTWRDSLHAAHHQRVQRISTSAAQRALAALGMCVPCSAHPPHGRFFGHDSNCCWSRYGARPEDVADHSGDIRRSTANQTRGPSPGLRSIGAPCPLKSLNRISGVGESVARANDGCPQHLLQELLPQTVSSML